MSRVVALGACLSLALGLRQREQLSEMRTAATSEPEALVELLAGTDARDGGSSSDGNVLPQVKRPHGMNDWVPETNPQGGAWWFRRGDTEFHGMRCTHQPSPWIGDYGQFLVQPHFGSTPSLLRYDANASEFKPHHFKTRLADERHPDGSGSIDFELTATSRAALLRVGFPSSGGKAAELGAYVSVLGEGLRDVLVEDGVLRGRSMAVTHDAPKGWRGVFFVLKPVSPGSKVEPGEATGSLRLTSTAASGEAAAPTTHTLAIGTSFISHDQAERNLHSELGKRTFDEAMQENRAAWRSLLGRVRVEALDKERLKVFYTNLWRSMLFPRNLHEFDASGEAVHFSPYTGDIQPGRLVADSGFWDSYRTVYTLKSVIAPEQYGKLVDGWLTAYKEVKWLPQWASPDQRPSMVGTMGDFVLADAIAKNKWGVLGGFDAEEAYEAIRKDAFVDRGASGQYGREGLKDYIRDGYVKTSDSDESVTETQGYWLADAAMSQAAAALGKTQDAEVLERRSRRYASLFNNQTGFFQPKDQQGHFARDFDPLAWKDGFTEASAWQYRFDVPHDVAGLNQLFEGQLCGKIGEMLQKTSGEYFHVGGYGQVIHEMREAVMLQKDFGLYAHSNQPVHHILWIAKKAGCNDLGDAYLRKVMRKLYTSHGWSGDEDNGEMASWYVLASLGIFQLEGAKDEMVLGSPSVVRGTVDLPEGRLLTIATKAQADANVHVQGITWEPTEGAARQIDDNVLKYTELMKGGVLTFAMGSHPKAPATVLPPAPETIEFVSTKAT